ncbi:MAG: PspC domain-containing protein [Acidimicrobiaceae bacterium]|nr:PspC domain-containing protein [Acidimicrobiaceae bacterium]
MPISIAESPTLGVALRPLRRSDRGAILGGVCAGLAVRLGLSERTIRVAFSLTALFGGFGLILYLALWLSLTRSGEETSIARRLSKRPHGHWSNILLWSAVFIGVVGFASSRRVLTSGFVIFWLFTMGVVAIWRGASTDEQSRIRAFSTAVPLLGVVSTRGWRAVAYRLIPGVLLVVVGLNVLNRVGGVWGAAVPALIGSIVLIGGVSILLAPWWLQTVRDLTNERRERVRIEERATMVAHIHDSVLQTLTLIERAAANETDVIRLARAQERELRQWLFDPQSLNGRSPSESFAKLARSIEDDVEKDYGVKVELVIVGDCEVDERVQALLAAAREAAVNSAKWSRAPIVSIYAEVEPQVISVFVRDLGQGFDDAKVANDRQGIALSIKGRMSQVGGQATVRSAPGSGTEVQLELPRRHP